MTRELQPIIAELEAITARMLTTSCWEKTSEFVELSASQHELAALLVNRRDLDASAAERIRAVIHAGDGLVAQILAMRRSVADALVETERQQRFNHEVSGTVHRQAGGHNVDMEV